MKTYTLKTPWGTETVWAIKRQYQKGTLAVELLSQYEVYWEPYAVITVNLDPYTGMDRQSDKKAYIDTNNCPWAETFLKENGIASPCGENAAGGFCTYPLYEFNLTKLDEAEF